MSQHHKNALPAVAQAIYDGMAATDRAEVEKKAREKGVDPLEMVRLSLDILISESPAGL